MKSILWIQIQEQIRTYMTSTITYEYGVNLDKEWNKIVTSSWDEAQQRVSKDL